MLRTREQVRVLSPADRDVFVALTEQDPVVNVFAGYRARLTNLDERWLGGQVWGRFEGDELVAGCHLGANLVPVQCTPDDVGAFADAASELPEGDFRRTQPRFTGENARANRELLKPVRAIAEAHGATPAQVALAWVLGQGPYVVPVPGAKQERWAVENAGAAGLVLTEGDLDEIAGLPRARGSWD